jgi:hypothetical protein
MKIHTDPELEEVFKAYPRGVKQKLIFLRKLVRETAQEEGIEELQETLKWGEPSFLTKKGSTIRMDWKEKKPDHYAIYFKCTSKLVPSFKAVFKDTFIYEGDRAIVFHMDDGIPERELKQALAAALRYHQVKHLPLLGMKTSVGHKN